jgi:outer membrane protein TolC
VEVARRQDELVGALNEMRLATAELARILRLDPMIPLEPIEDFRHPIPIPLDGWPDRPLPELAEAAFRNRPDLAENQALVRAALARVQAAQWRPFLPNANLNYAWGDFGGGPDLNPPLVLPPTTPGGRPRVVTVPGNDNSGTIRHFAPRTDFDASLFWRLDNLGLGNRAERREQQSIYRGTVLRQLQIEDRVVTQVVQARELVQGWRERVNLLRASLFNAQGAPEGPVFLSIRLSFERIRGGEGRPLELLDSIRGLSDVLEAYGQAVTEYERAEIQLWYALGLPFPALWRAEPGHGSAKTQDAYPPHP